MKAKLSLKSPLWNSAQRKATLSKVILQSAAQLESRIKRRILDSSPRGRLYKRGVNRFHRASAKGQAPAVDSGGLINSIRARAVGVLKAVVATSKNYAPRLDAKNKFNRPFFESEAESFRAEFKQNIADALKQK